MKYYIIQHDWELNLLENEDSFDPYVGEPINFGEELNFPKIKLKFNSENIPDSIPNINGYIIFNQRIISVFKEAGLDYIQYFDVDVEDDNGNVISNEYKCLNILKVIDAIDFENSKLSWSDEETEKNRFIMGITDLRLKYPSINNELFFILKGGSNPLVLREDLAQAIVNKGCTGLEFYNAEGYSS